MKYVTLTPQQRTDVNTHSMNNWTIRAQLLVSGDYALSEQIYNLIRSAIKTQLGIDGLTPTTLPNSDFHWSTNEYVY